MKYVKLLLALLSLTVSCDCEEQLYRTCPIPEPCVIKDGLENSEENLILGEELTQYTEIGECKFGTTKCTVAGIVYCDGYIGPKEEVCDGLDNDCDNLIDEGYDKDRDGYTSCGGDCNDNNPNINPSAVEKCNKVDDNCDGVIPDNEIQDLDGDNIVSCMDCNDFNNNQAPGVLEICDGVDNNCNGEIDENVIELISSCGPSEMRGACMRGTNVCVDGELYCINAVYPVDESCDNIDNDCDGMKDEELARQCQTECGIGVEFCLNGGWVGCTAPTPSAELCDGFDNDCNGIIDDNCNCAEGELEFCTGGTISPITGEILNCGTGVKTCDDKGEWGPCIYAFNREEQCNNYDDDCDGVIDQIQSQCGEGPQQYNAIGECKYGNTICENGQWGECVGAVSPVNEICNEKDDDCDGEIDEGLNSHEKVDMVFAIDGSGSMCQYTTALAQGIGQYVSDFEESEHRFALIIFPFERNVTEIDIPWILVTNLVDVYQFIAVLNSINCVYPAEEPSYDVMYDMADASNPIGINWRNDAYPYLIMMTDEQPQTWLWRTKHLVAGMTSNCNVGECVAGDKFEVYVFTHTVYFPGWDAVVFYETNRLISIGPPDPTAYANKLRTVFTNICL